MIALKKKAKTTKCSNHSTISIISHTAKIAMGYLEEGLKGKLRMELEMINLDLERKRNQGCRQDAENNIRKNFGHIGGSVCVCVCFIDWQKAFDHVNWTKLMHILKGTGINWSKRKFISKLCKDQGVKLKLHRGRKEDQRLEEGHKEIQFIADSIQLVE